MHAPTVTLKTKPRTVVVSGKKKGPKVTLKRRPVLYHGFHVSREFRKVTVWGFDATTKQRVHTDTCTPLCGATRESRIITIARFLKNNFNLTLTP